MKFITILGLFLCLGVSSLLLSQAPSKNIQLKIQFADSLQSEVASNGRLFVFFSKTSNGQPRYSVWPNPWSLTPIYAKNMTGMKVNSANEISDFTTWASTTKETMNSIADGAYYVQVLWDQDTSESRINVPGNLYSDVQRITVEGDFNLDFTINNLIPKRSLVEHELVKLVDMQSDTLTTWWNKPVRVKASVLLPNGYVKGKAYPIRYNVAGYGGRYDRVNRLVKNQKFIDWWMSEEAPEVINVFLDGEGPFGDSYQMDSENSGPYGYSLINELIPYIEKEYRGTQSPDTRFVDGCSTGGWVSLGLQLYYPDEFNGVFSYSPDAIEFENYQLTNIYKDKNVYVNEFGYSRPVMRDTNGEPLLSMETFVQYENVLGASNTYLNSGGQFSAHTALYSPKGDNGLPKPLFDPETGAIDASVAEHWKKYDFKIYAKENWKELGPKVAGKIYIWMGDMDHFYLNPATRVFAQYLETTEDPKSDAQIEFAAMEGHCSRFSNKLILEQIKQRLSEMKEASGE